jgi:hypothetical protein
MANTQETSCSENQSSVPRAITHPPWILPEQAPKAIKLGSPCSLMQFMRVMERRFLEISLALATLQSFPIREFPLAMNVTLENRQNVFVGL